MSRVNIPLNYAIMIEQVKKEGKKENEILLALQNGDTYFFESCGKGLPDWETLLAYYQTNKEKLIQVVEGDYKIAFLTKGTLKRWVMLKFNLIEGRNYEDEGEMLTNFKLLKKEFQTFQSILSDNWQIAGEQEKDGNIMFHLELAYRLE